MATESGYSNQKKYGEAQYKTIQHVGSDKFGVNTAQMYLFDITPVATPISNVTVDSESSQKIWLEITNHQARIGDIIRFPNSADPMFGWELEVIEVLDANILSVYNLGLPTVGQMVKTCRWITAKADAEGALTTTAGPVQFIKNGITSTVVEDTVDPNNNQALPVKLMGTAGPINITAGDLNVQMTDTGANFDSLRVGDGSGNYIGVTANDEALTHDPEAIAALESIDTKTPALVSGRVPVDTGLAQPLTDALLRATPVPVQGTVTVGNFPSVQTVSVNNFPASQTVQGTVSVDNFPATQAVTAASLPLPTGAATETTLAALSAKLPISLGQKAASGSMSVVLASGTSLSTSDANIGLTTDVKATDPNGTGTVIAILKGILEKTGVGSAPVASYQEDVSVTTSVETITAPVGAKWCKIQADDTNTGNMRVKIGGAASASSGIQFQPGRSEDFAVAGNISYCMESGSGKIYVIFGA